MSNQWIHARFAITAAIAIGIFCVVIGMRQTGRLEALELIAYDWMLRTPARLVMEDPPVTLIKIREHEIQRYGHPLCDKRMALALAKLLSYEPRGIGVDIYRHARDEGTGQFWD